MQYILKSKIMLLPWRPSSAVRPYILCIMRFDMKFVPNSNVYTTLLGDEVDTVLKQDGKDTSNLTP